MPRLAPALLLLTALGCGPTADSQSRVDAAANRARAKSDADAVGVEAAREAAEVAAERAKLPPADRELVEAQEWCPVSEGNRLGSMGPPLKLELLGKPAFVCCEGCTARAHADPAKTLAKVEELRAKKAAE